MQLGKYKLRKETPRVIWNKRIRPLWDERLRDNNVWTNRFLIITNNFCNMACWSCSALCNRPIGSNPFRKVKEITPLENIKKFLDLIDGYRPDYWIRLSGGEVTLCEPDYIKAICDLTHEHGRNISLLTNGARMDLVDPDWFEFIHLDEHILNSQTIADTRERFKDIGYKRYQVWTTKEHRDLELQRTNHITKGLRCEANMEAITLWRDTMYNCCVLPFLDGWNGDTKIRDSQLAAGWSIHNPNLVETMENWINTLQADSVFACQTQCWKDGKNLVYNPVS